MAFLCSPLWIWNRVLLFNRSYKSIGYRFSGPLPALLNENLCFNKILLGGQEGSFDWKVLMLKGRQSDRNQVKSGVFFFFFPSTTEQFFLMPTPTPSILRTGMSKTIFVYKDALNSWSFASVSQGPRLQMWWGIKPRALCVLGKHWTTELHSQTNSLCVCLLLTSLSFLPFKLHLVHSITDSEG